MLQNTGMGHGNIGMCSTNIPGPQECWDVPVTPWNEPQEHWDGAQEHLWDYSGMLGWALERSGWAAEMLGCTTESSLGMSRSPSPGPWKGLHQGKPGSMECFGLEKPPPGRFFLGHLPGRGGLLRVGALEIDGGVLAAPLHPGIFLGRRCWHHLWLLLPGFGGR